MAEACVAGRGPRAARPDPEALRRIGTFVELHVEQGRALVDLGRAVARRHRRSGRTAAGGSTCAGRADHAGTTRLDDRDDPMLAFARRRPRRTRAAAERHGAVATCGKVQVAPNGVNAIPSHVTAWLDARGEDAERVRAVVADVAAIAGGVTEESWTDRTPFDPGLARRLAVLLDDAPLLPTGAGTTRASCPRPGSRPPCCTCATPPASRTAPRSTPRTPTAPPGSAH